MKIETSTLRLLCMAEALRLSKAPTEETPEQNEKRKQLIARIFATNMVLQDETDPRVVYRMWDSLWQELFAGKKR